MLGHKAQWPNRQKPNTTYQHKNLSPTVKHGGGRVVIWACFVVAGPLKIAITELIMSDFISQYFRDKCEAIYPFCFAIVQSKTRPDLNSLNLNLKFLKIIQAFEILLG